MVPPTTVCLMPNNKGFTLIELLIVISIIAVLSTIGLVSYSNFLKSSRDAKRQSDLKFIQSALEDYHSDHIYYPFDVQSLTAGSKTYLNKIPNDPKTPPDYSYEALGTNCTADTPKNCTKYCLYAQMEGTAPSSDSGCIKAGYNFGITRP